MFIVETKLGTDWQPVVFLKADSFREATDAHERFIMSLVRPFDIIRQLGVVSIADTTGYEWYRVTRQDWTDKTRVRYIPDEQFGYIRDKIWKRAQSLGKSRELAERCLWR